MTWYEKFGFKDNPLDSRPNPDLVGLEKEEERLKNHIVKEEICFLNGLTGSGKTSMLHRVQKSLPGHKFIYLDAQDLPKNFNLEEELRNKRSFFDKISLKRWPRKKPVLIIDEFQATDPDLVLAARAKWENPGNRKIRSIVIAQISKYLENVTPAFKERLGKKIVVLRNLDDDEMKELLRRRLMHSRQKVNYLHKVSDEALDLLIQIAGGNPRRLLEYADMLFDFHVQKFGKNNPLFTEGYVISEHAAKEILANLGVTVQGYKRKKVKKTVFSENDEKVLRVMESPKTTKQIASSTGLSRQVVRKTLAGLRKKHAILNAGRKGRQKLWQVSPQAHRFRVNV